MKNNHIYIFLFLCLFASCVENDTKSNVDNTTSSKHVEVAKETPPRFSRVNSDISHIKVKNSINESENMNIYTYEYLYNGGGVSVGDINNDGLPDLFFTINMGINRLYLNKGNMNFEDISTISNIQLGMDWSTGSTMIDINNDGWLDIYVCRSGKFSPEQRKNALFVNNKNNTFTEQAELYGLADQGFSTQASFFDFDNDGDLDMYLANHPAEFHLKTNEYLKRKKAPHDFERDKLYRNDNGKFVDVSKEAGILNYSHSLGLITTDFNGDGWTDIYVSNDYYEQDHFYLNLGNGSFKEQAKTALKHMAKSSMGADAGDFNNDGAMDFLTVEMMAEDNKRQKTNMAPMNPKLFNDQVKDGFGKQFMHNVLQLNNGDGAFSDIAYMANVATTDWSWAPLFGDYDNDGYLDLFVSNGYKRDILDKDFKKDMKKIMGNKRMAFDELKTYMPASIVPNYIFKNNKDLTFTNKSKDWGLDQLVNSNGACYSDLDLDGDLDLIVNNLDAEMSLFKNNSSDLDAPNYLKIKFNGVASNKNGIGTKVFVSTGDNLQYKQLSLTHGYQSSMEPILHFGIGSFDKVDNVKVVWFDGKIQIIENVTANQMLSIDYNDAKTISNNKSKEKSELELNDITDKSRINYKHTERIYNDYKDQILLPHKLSQNGPGVAIGDVDGNGFDDFYVCGAAGQSGVLFMQGSNNVFSKKVVSNSDKQFEDMGALLFDADNDGDLDLYVVSGSYETSMLTKPYQDRLYLNNGKGNFKKSKDLLPEMNSSGSCVLASDYDNDGDLDLFIGGRVIPGKYPYAPKSFILENNQGKFTDVTSEVAPGLSEVGMVTSGIWSDYDNDDDKDLIIVGEWMPITIFKNEKGKLIETKNKELSKTSGWWNSISGADIDNDGDIDYVLGNLGLNSKNKASENRPFEVYCDDFDGNNTYDIALGYYNGSSGVCYPVRGRQCSSEQVPSIAKKIKSYDLFGESSIQDVYGEAALANALHYKAYLFESVVLINNKGTFEIRSLTNKAQMAPNYGSVVEDFDLDGCLDIFFVGNQFPVEVETGQYDAHKGLLLRGDCSGEFVDAPFNLSEKIDGDTKSLSLIRLGKGNLGMLVGTNDEKLRLIKINKDRLRVEKSTELNTLKSLPKGGNRKVEYYYGSGYLSQNSNFRILY